MSTAKAPAAPSDRICEKKNICIEYRLNLQFTFINNCTFLLAQHGSCPSGAYSILVRVWGLGQTDITDRTPELNHMDVHPSRNSNP